MAKIQKFIFTLQKKENEKEVMFIANADDKNQVSIKVPNINNLLPFCKSLTCSYNDDNSKTFNDKDEIKDFLVKAVDQGEIIECREYKEVKVSFEDITEQILLGSYPIKMDNLQSRDHGLYANIGKRKIKVQLDGEFPFETNDECRVKISLNGFDGTPLREIDVADIESDSAKLKDNCAIVTLNTDDFNKVFDGDYRTKKYVTLGGYVCVVCEFSDRTNNTYCYPMELCAINTRVEVFDRRNKMNRYASIDFGTSSTCVAIDGQEDGKSYELLSISPIIGKKRVNEFENPTNLMLYNWSALYDEWKELNNIPLVHKGDQKQYNKFAKDKENNPQVDFDFGYTVKELFSNDSTTRQELNAILTLLKMIPSKIAESKSKDSIVVRPYNSADEHIVIVSDPDAQDEKHFDPIAFYGFLIGRAINDCSTRKKIYMDYKVTSPVGFNNEIKEKLRKSLEYGLKRAVPKTLRDEIHVEMKHTEPVAYIGAVCGTDYFKVTGDKPKLFAVYDFGGGTLDFSYGLASYDDNDDELTINIKRTGKGTNGSSNIGGEKIIEILAYQVYCYNDKLVNENKIPIEVPYGEAKKASISDNLTVSSAYAKANMNILANQITRELFEGRGLPSASEEYHLFNCDGEPISLQLSIPDTELEERIESIVQKTVEQFKNEMDLAFKDVEGYNADDVYIFKSGNSSRSEVVKKKLEETFPNSKIQLVDQIEDKKEPNKRYAITPKTAVAIGQLKLNDHIVKGAESKFQFYVGIFKAGTGEYKSILKSCEEEGVWMKGPKIKTGASATDLYISRAIPSSTNEAQIISIPTQRVNSNAEKEYLYIRARGENILDYCVSENEPSENVAISSYTLNVGGSNV